MKDLLQLQVTKEQIDNYYLESFPNVEDSTDRHVLCDWCLKSNPFPELRKRYQEPQRFYHNENHLNELNGLINFLKNKNLIDKYQSSKLYLISFFHDAVYDPTKFDNEEKSAELFLEFVIRDLEFVIPEMGYTLESKKKIIKERHSNPDEVFEIYQAILDTKTHEPSSEISKIFCSIDLFCLTNYNFTELVEYEQNIFKEYQFYDYLLYHEKRLEIINAFSEKISNPNLKFLVEYIRNRKIKIGLYPGSFRPFHIGHLDVLQKAEQVLDKVIICRGINPAKQNKDFESKFDFAPYREVKEFQNYQVDLLESLNNEARKYEQKNKLPKIVEYVFVRGLRNHTDFDFEFNQLQYSKNLAKEKNQNFNTVFFFSEPNLQHISSSDIRAMESFKSGSAKHLIV